MYPKATLFSLIRVSVFAGLLLLSAAAQSQPEGASECRRNELTYDQVQQKSIHNAYLLAEALMDQLVYYRIRNIEVDIRPNHWLDPFGLNVSDDNDWHVFHTQGERGSRNVL